MIVAVCEDSSRLRELAQPNPGSMYDEYDLNPPAEETDEPNELEEPQSPWSDDERWDVFLPDDEPYEPEPAPGDFWIDFAGNEN